MQPLILDLNFWHQSILTTIMSIITHSLSLHAAKLININAKMFIMCIKAIVAIVALCYVALASLHRGISTCGAFIITCIVALFITPIDQSAICNIINKCTRPIRTYICSVHYKSPRI